MARTAGKKASKPSVQPAQSKAASTTTPSPVPEPFTVVPSSLRPFVTTLPTDHVYAVHVDRNPVALKKRVYTVPVLMNLIIAAGLAVRVYYALPTYVDQLVTIFGYQRSWKADYAAEGVGGVVNVITERTFLLMLDYALFALLGSWPWEFVFGSKYNRHTGAWEWRRTLGFQDAEIVVRMGRKWDTPLLIPRRKEKESKPWTLEDELTLKFKIEPAMRTSYTSKTGYLLLDKDWDLDFKGIMDAHKFVKAGAIKLEDLDHVVFVHYQKQWLMWKVHASATADAAQVAAATADEDTTLRKFRDKLVSLGREDVFFRWIEIVQYESSLPGGFTQGKQGEALRELRRLLTERGVDYAKFWEEIGGQPGVPGLN